jgi:hypothetical protein
VLRISRAALRGGSAQNRRRTRSVSAVNCSMWSTPRAAVCDVTSYGRSICHHASVGGQDVSRVPPSAWQTRALTELEPIFGSSARVPTFSSKSSTVTLNFGSGKNRGRLRDDDRRSGQLTGMLEFTGQGGDQKSERTVSSWQNDRPRRRSRQVMLGLNIPFDPCRTAGQLQQYCAQLAQSPGAGWGTRVSPLRHLY